MQEGGGLSGFDSRRCGRCVMSGWNIRDRIVEGARRLSGIVLTYVSGNYLEYGVGSGN